MGTSVSTIHVFTQNPLPAEIPGKYQSFSEGWQTRLPEVYPEDDYEGDRKLARRLSRQLPYPVLYFWEFDSDEFGFVLFREGKQVTSFGTNEGPEGAKGIYKLPAQIGCPEGYKRRLSRILSCADVESTIAMLEEYFGVCLEVFTDLLETPEELKRTRSDELYRAYLEEERRFSGKNAPVSLELTEEIFGIVELTAAFADHSFGRKHIFYLAQFRNLLEMKEPLPAVEFREGKLIPADERTVHKAKERQFSDMDPPFETKYYPKPEVTFSEQSPELFRGRTFSLPRGFYPYDFDLFGHLILIADRGGIAFMDADGKVIAKTRIKGNLQDYRDGYLLVDTSSHSWGWGFDPKGLLRIYRIVDHSR